VKRTAVLEVLRENGLKMSQGTFDTQVYRIRQSRKAAIAKSAAVQTEETDKAPTTLTPQAVATQVPVIDDAAPTDNGDPLTAKDAHVRYPDIQQAQEKARRYISGPLDFDVDNLFKKGNQ
jgi:hypothetical protein